jgi:hypothetical protein
VSLWVDAICINQQDDDEKTEQLTRMADIYNRAFNVNVWLGTANQTSDKAMDFIRELVQFEQLQAMLHREESLGSWLALIDLMCSRWFSRRWVIQELALSRTASVHCGTKVVHWDDFADAISIFSGKIPVVRTEIQKSKKELHFKPEGLSIVEALGARALVRAKSDLLQKDTHGKILERNSTLEYLVSTLVSFDATDPRDTIYALLSISRKNPQQHLLPSYKKSILEVYTDFVKYCIELSNSLDIICRHWAPVNTKLIVKREKDSPAEQRRGTEKIVTETTLPSWISTLDNSAFGTPEKIFRGRKNADSLVGIQKVYNASGRYGAELSINTRFGTKRRSSRAQEELLIETFDGTLTVRGLVLGRVNTVSPRIIPGKLPQEVLEMGGWSYSLRDEDRCVADLQDTLWKTLVANRDHSGKTPETLYRRACLYCLQQEDVSGDVDIVGIENKPDAVEEVASFLKRAQEVIRNRKAFLGGTDNELFGLCPRFAVPTDLVCILYGCSVPVVLRGVRELPKVGQRLVPAESAEHTPATTRKRAHSRVDYENARLSDHVVGYRLIGECYVHGRMDGEAIDNDSYSQSEQDFKLV